MNGPILTQLKEYIATQILRQPNAIIKDDDPLITSGLVDSFHLVDLSLFIEAQFGVQIDDTELTADTFDTLDELVALIKSRQTG
jgi:acyl carrier protein